MTDCEKLKLTNNLCFPLYVVSKEIVKKYKPFLDEIGLTYTQYIVMMVLWEYSEINVKEIGKCLYLDSGTLTPVLKKLEQKDLVLRSRDKNDERVLMVSLTREGEHLKEKAKVIPKKVGACVALSDEERVQLKSILNKILCTCEEK